MSNQSNTWGENPEQEEEVSSENVVSQPSDVPSSEKEEPSYEASSTQAEDVSEEEDEPEESDEPGEDDRSRDRREIKRLRNEKYRILNEAKLLQEENEFLKNSNVNSHQASLMHYDNYLTVMKEQAKENKKRAIENGDTDEIVKADEELSRVIARAEQLNDYKTQQIMQMQRTQQQVQEQQYYPQEAPQIPFEVQEWLVNNKWYVPNTSEYHPQKAKMVMDYAQRLDMQLAREGRQNEYYTPDYFDRIDAFARNVDKSMNGKNISMKEPQRPVASVQAGRTVRPVPKEPELSKTEKEYIKWMKIKEDDYKKHKKLQMEKERMVDQQRRSIGYGGY